MTVEPPPPIVRPRWHLATLSFALAMRLLPRRFRFRAALVLSRLLSPLIARSATYRELRALKIDGLAEIALHLVLASMTRHGTEFDLMDRFEGFERLVEAMKGDRGIFIAAPHALLTYLILRSVHDHGHEALVVSADTDFRIPGTTVKARAIRPSPNYLVELRTRMRRGEIVGAMLDRSPQTPQRTVSFESASGPLLVSGALLGLALRCHARIFFCSAKVEGAHLRGRIAEPSPISTTKEAVTADFIDFMNEHVAGIVATQRRA